MTDTLELERYSRQTLFPAIQEEGQKKLWQSTVLVVGAGALGTVICNHLVRAGIGSLRIIDRDYVEMTNLQRQMLFDEKDVDNALPKSIAMKQKLEAINSTVNIEAITGNATSANIDSLTNGADVVMDGTDNMATRFLLNDVCFRKGIPFSYGGVVSSRGMSAFFIPNKTPCLRCMTKGDTGGGETCDTVGVLSPAVDVVASLEVMETLKFLTGNDSALRNTLHTFDMWYHSRYDMKFGPPDTECPTCQKQIYPALKTYTADIETVLCGRNTVQIHQKTRFDLKEWSNKLKKVATIKETPFLIKAQLQGSIQFVLFPDGRVLIQGTEDTVKARTWYDRYIGS